MNTLLPAVRIDGLFTGSVRPLTEDGRSSAIVKTAASGALPITPLGLAGDEQADLRVHGGVGKALHLFPAEHLARLQTAFPAARNLHPGGLGENFSTSGLTEDQVCIGDVFALGAARIQVSQPRRPCWKIDQRTGCPGMMAYVFAQGISGWYFRVLEPGQVAVGDLLTHIHRPADAPTLTTFWSLTRNERYPVAALERLATATGLEPGWRTRLLEHAEVLRREACA